MAEEKIMTKHPSGKSGRNISVKNYDMMKQAMLKALQSKELTHTELMNALNKDLKGKFPDNINWYAEAIKLDLEARKIIERTSTKPAKYRVRRVSQNKK